MTSEVMSALPEIRDFSAGLLHLFLLHTSASLTINENADPDVPVDMGTAFDRLVPESWEWQHSCEGPDDMPAHVKTTLSDSSLTIPIAAGRLVVGTWQGIYLCEHRNHGGSRRLFATMFGRRDED